MHGGPRTLLPYMATQIDSLATTHCFKQIISDTTHLLPQSSSCIDLHPSLHRNCHHEITFCNLNLKVNLKVEYPNWVNRVNKSHGYDDISVRLLKICDYSIVKPLSIIFKNCWQNRSFPNNWEKSNVVLIHKKGDKQLLQNYRLVSLMPICGKMLERIIFNPIFKYLEKNSPLCPNQSGFRRRGSREN